MECLKKNMTVSRKSSLLKLTPFLDEKGLLRVKGRLIHSTLPPASKHPVILPASGRLTELIIQEAHHDTLHGGARFTLAHLRQKYWIIGGNRTVKKQLRQCIKCHRFKPHRNEQLMADLPKERVTPTRPFTNTGVDFTGHVDIKINKGRGVKTCKAYIAIFICTFTKAVHLELVSDLTTQTFLAAFKRMCARRGTPKHMFSNNGTNFVRSKWQQPQKDPEEGNLVLNNKDEYLPPGKWALGRVTEAHPGSDDKVRVVTLKTKRGHLTRPITKLVPLPLNENLKLPNQYKNRQQLLVHRHPYHVTLDPAKGEHNILYLQYY
ncbi:uncharacterized protein LOC113239247 [Hyposmocoma kahamanoa]|uniref:uncharacterized protein LOC113239247 n=1 Tax=Hyposmocoma kahamanoa TaxID=1477025 RepID=UPI000E6D8F02|nr:uncharacterized protein LOC113239247 [Hyposmocoma kahamanoa]